MKELKITVRVKETGETFNPDMIDFYNRQVVKDYSMVDLTGYVGISFDDVDIYIGYEGDEEKI